MNDPLVSIFCSLPRYWQVFIMLLFPIKAIADVVFGNPGYAVSSMGPCYNLCDVFAAIARDVGLL